MINLLSRVVDDKTDQLALAEGFELFSSALYNIITLVGNHVYLLQ